MPQLLLDVTNLPCEPLSLAARGEDDTAPATDKRPHYLDTTVK